MMRSRVKMTTMLFALILSFMIASCSAKNNKQSDTKVTGHYTFLLQLMLIYGENKK